MRLSAGLWMCVNSCDTERPSICAKKVGLSSNEEEDMANGDFLKIALRGELLSEEVTNTFSPPNPHCFWLWAFRFSLMETPSCMSRRYRSSRGKKCSLSHPFCSGGRQLESYKGSISSGYVSGNPFTLWIGTFWFASLISCWSSPASAAAVWLRIWYPLWELLLR